MAKRGGAIGLALGLIGASASVGHAADWQAEGVPIPRLSIDMDTITVSGISSGAFMANQLHVAESATFQGAGLVAGGLYGCSVSTTVGKTIYSTATRAIGPCMSQPTILEGVDHFLKWAREFEEKGLIDPLENLDGDPIYLFTGRADTVVATKTVDTAKEFYDALNAKTTYVDRVPPSAGPDERAGHSFITVDEGNPDCSAEKVPYVNACNYDQAGVILKTLLGDDLNPPGPSLGGTLSAFDQTLYTPGGEKKAKDQGIWHTGFVYIPQSCSAAGANCKLHVALHGCKQSDQNLGKDDKFYNLIGMNQWADTNNIVVLYPQARTVSASFTVPLTAINPEGCWNWWGYGLDSNYLVKSGDQISAIMRMIDAMDASAD
ncbi:MAG: depolymerase [Rhodospirillaceae bacterium]